MTIAFAGQRAIRCNVHLAVVTARLGYVLSGSASNRQEQVL